MGRVPGALLVVAPLRARSRSLETEVTSVAHRTCATLAELPPSSLLETRFRETPAKLYKCSIGLPYDMGGISPKQYAVFPTSGIL